MNVLSLFDGVSCGQMALNRAKIKYEKYYASEIDANAIKATQINYPETIQLGDIEKWKDWDIDWATIGLIMAGSPCQGFSFAGKQLAFDDPRSKLFFTFMDILNHVKKLNPKVKFLLENVYMVKEHEVVISKLTGIAPLKINSSLVSAQVRKRNYWTNFRLKQVGLFGYDEIDIPQPEDRGIVLNDILEKEVGKKYYLSKKMLNYFTTRKANFNAGKINFKYGEDKASCFTASCFTASSGHLDISDNIIVEQMGVINNRGIIEETATGKSQCLDANYAKGMDNHGQRTFIQEVVSGSLRFGRNEEAKAVRRENMKKGKDYSPFAQKEITGIDFEKSGTILTTPAKDNLIIQLNPSTESGGVQPYQQNRVYSPAGKSPALSTDPRPPSLFIPEATKQGYAEIEPGDCFDFEHPDSKTRRGRKMGKMGKMGKSNTLMAAQNNFMQFTEDAKIRRLTPIEVCRLQTIPDDYFYKNGKQIISDTAIYKACGNGWTVDVITHLLKYSGL